jgi:hypothetical protein
MSKQRRWTQEDLDSTVVGKDLGKKKVGRYGNVRKPVHDGIKFDSKREFLRYMDLKMLERAGEIHDIQVHPRYPIIIAGIEIRLMSKRYHKAGRLLVYEADFEYVRDGETVIEDVKMQSGHRTEVYKIKRALMKAMGHNIEEY